MRTHDRNRTRLPIACAAALGALVILAVLAMGGYPLRATAPSGPVRWPCAAAPEPPSPPARAERDRRPPRAEAAGAARTVLRRVDGGSRSGRPSSREAVAEGAPGGGPGGGPGDAARVERVVAGRLLDELGQPWSGWVVTARAGGRPAGRTRTDALGRFELTVATDEPLDVLASNGAEQRSARGVLPPRVGVEVVLPRAGTVRLEVVDRVTGDRVRGFDIHRRASARSGPFLRNPAPEPDSSGLVRWTVPTGTWDVAVDARSQGYALGTASCVRVEPWGEVALRVELDRGTTLAVDVVGLPHGVGLNMWLVPVEEGARGSGIATSGWGRLLQEEVGFDGERHVVRGVVPGRYRLSAFDRIEATGITLHGQPEVTVAARYLPPSPLTPEQEAFLRRVYEQGLFCPDD